MLVPPCGGYVYSSVELFLDAIAQASGILVFGSEQGFRITRWLEY